MGVLIRKKNERLFFCFAKMRMVVSLLHKIDEDGYFPASRKNDDGQFSVHEKMRIAVFLFHVKQIEEDDPSITPFLIAIFKQNFVHFTFALKTDLSFLCV